MKAIKWLCVALLLGMSLQQVSFAQDDDEDDEDDSSAENAWNYGDNPELAREKKVLFTDEVKYGNTPENAIAPLNWILENVPDMNVSIYINAERLYKKLIKKEADQAKKEQYQDALLALFDKRIEVFGDEGPVLMRKGRRAYGYLLKRENKNDYFQPLYDLYAKVVELNGNDTDRYNVLYFIVISNYQKQLKRIDEDQMIANYEAVQPIIEHNLANSTSEKDKAGWEKTAGSVDKVFEKAVTIDCDRINELMGPNLRKNPKDIGLAKRTLKYLLQNKCDNDELFIFAAEVVSAEHPDPALIKAVAQKYAQRDELDKSFEWIDKGMAEVKEEAEKADFLMLKAGLEAKNGKYGDARKSALEAAKLDGEKAKDAYSFVGDLYYNSGGRCKTDDEIQSRACYMAAYDMYAKAGDSAGMGKAKQQFPTVEDAFGKGKKEGDTLNVGCWIGGTVKLRTR